MPHPALAERALIDHGDFRRRGQPRLASRALDDERHRQPRAQHRGLLQVLKRLDRLAVDRLDEVARHESRALGGRSGFDAADPRGVLGPAESHEKRGENDEGENEVGDRPGRDDRRAIAQRLAGQGLRPLARATSPPCPRCPARSRRSRRREILRNRRGERRRAASACRICRHGRRVRGRNRARTRRSSRRTSVRRDNGQVHERRRSRS